jgi:calcineurin-like phosphoesterase family protein
MIFLYQTETKNMHGRTHEEETKKKMKQIIEIQTTLNYKPLSTQF